MPPTPKLATLTYETGAPSEPGWVRYRVTKKTGGTPSWVMHHKCFNAADELVYEDGKGMYWSDGKNGDALLHLAEDKGAVRVEAWVSNDVAFAVPL